MPAKCKTGGNYPTVSNEASDKPHEGGQKPVGHVRLQSLALNKVSGMESRLEKYSLSGWIKGGWINVSNV